MWRKFVKALEWIGHGNTAVQVAGWAGIPTAGFAGFAVTFFSSAVDGWSVTAVWIASVATGTLLAVLYAALMIGLAYRRNKDSSKGEYEGKDSNRLLPNNAPATVRADETFGFGQTIYYESRSIKAPDGRETRLYETKFSIVVSNASEDGKTLRDVQAEIHGYETPVLAGIRGFAFDKIDLFSNTGIFGWGLVADRCNTPHWGSDLGQVFKQQHQITRVETAFMNRLALSPRDQIRLPKLDGIEPGTPSHRYHLDQLVSLE
jgi:hypothetical protein